MTTAVHYIQTKLPTRVVNDNKGRKFNANKSLRKPKGQCRIDNLQEHDTERRKTQLDKYKDEQHGHHQKHRGEPRCLRIPYGLNGVRVMVLDATFNNISVLSSRKVLLVEETEVPGENHRPVASH